MNFFSRGKLLISGEYLVLKGATALAVPLVNGQDLKVLPTAPRNRLVWESREFGQTWFTAVYQLPFFDVVESTDPQISDNLVRHFRAIEELKPGFAEQIGGSSVVTNLDFKREWGFGSSSSLLSNLAWWSGTDPFQLHKKLSAGSGYDVVGAREDGPFFYKRSKNRYVTEQATLNASVTRQLYFVYLGVKKDSARSVSSFLMQKKAFRVEKRVISELSHHLAHAATIVDFGYYMKEHELVLSSVLKIPSLKEERFKDLPGEAKSLGAWGGDFAMITWTETTEELERYLSEKGLNTYFAFNDLVKTR